MESTDRKKPNVILILADDLGHGEISYNQDYYSTPNIDKLCKQGAYFERFYVQSQCSPTRAALMTGTYPWRFGMNYGIVKGNYFGKGIPVEKSILPELLKENGYLTSIIGKWHLGHESFRSPRTQGYFDYQFGLIGGSSDHFSYLVQKEKFDLSENGVPQYQYKNQYSTHVFEEKAIEFIKSASETESPFFLYLPITAPHGPIQCPIDSLAHTPRKFLNKTDTTKYWMVKTLDNLVGSIITKTEELGIEDETVIIFTSDNGADSNKELKDIWNFPFRGGKGRFYEGGVRTPLAIYWPEEIKPQRIKEQQATHIIDLYSTILSIAGGKPERNTDGLDLQKVINKEENFSDRLLVLNVVDKKCFALYQSGYKMLNNANEKNNNILKPLDENIEFYNVMEDKKENNPLLWEDHTVGKRLYKYSKKYYKEFKNIEFAIKYGERYKAPVGKFHRLGVFKNNYPKESFLPSTN